MSIFHLIYYNFNKTEKSPFQPGASAGFFSTGKHD